MIEYGLTIAIAGAATGVILAGIGSILGVRTVGQASAGLVSENPDAFGKVLILTALPGSQGIYGFLAAVIIANKVGLLTGAPIDISVAQGFQILFAAIPVGILGMFSAMFQGRLAAAGVQIVAKKPEAGGKGVILSAIVETYAVLGLLITILLVNGLVLA
ncbi:MAG: V-type ATP synthase subunit K [bacterium]|nr:V-type ATP synthase subunit K [bacterium]